MKKVKKGIVLLTALLGFNTYSNAGAIVDFSPTEDVIACSGGDHVIYLLDKKTLAVTKRIRTKESINDECFWFSPDGKSFWYSDYETIHQLNTTTWETIKTIDFNGDFYLNNDKSEFVCLKTYQKKITGYKLNDGSQTLNYKLNTTKDITSLTFSPDNSKLFILFKPKDSDNEEKVKYEYAELREMETSVKLEKEAKGDGKEAGFMIIDKISGEQKTEKTTWYSKYYSAQVFAANDGYYIASREGVAFVDSKFNVTTLPIESGANHYTYDYTNNKIIALKYEEIIIFDPIKKTNKILDISQGEHADGTEYITSRNGVYIYNYDNYAIGMATEAGIIKEATPFY
jgi:hypothetical protein